MEVIYKFFGRRRFLSNDYKTAVAYQGLTYENAESAFQAQKCVERAYEFVGLRPNEAIVLGNTVELRKDWDKVRDGVMYEIVRCKFVQNSKIRRMLVDTAGREIVWSNFCHENHFGDCSCEKCADIKGENLLGKILMMLRQEFIDGFLTTSPHSALDFSDNVDYRDDYYFNAFSKTAFVRNEPFAVNRADYPDEE
ncbi:MAG: NADAR family protein [Cardiobacteriaceae bacterium]|nr:NADAR family protein [Cardiobacteriaceae bacterium]